MESYHIVKDATELRKLIDENPDLPIAVMVGSDAACEDYSYTYCTFVRAAVDEILDCDPGFDNDGYVFNDRDDFKEKLQSWMEDQDEYSGLSDAEFDAAFEAKAAEFEPHWKKCICIRADN